MTARPSIKQRPNVLFLIADDHRFDGVGACGNPVVKTPTLDRLAEDGVSFESIYTMGGQTAALCVPSRAALLTGANVFRATVSGGEVGLGDTENPELWALNPDLATLPETLRREGYRTFGIGKWHNGKESFARGFADGASIFFGGMGDHEHLPLHKYDPSGAFPDDAAEPSKTFSSERFADAAIDYIRGHREEEDPFFLYVAFTAPHDPRTPPKSYADLYPADRIPLPANFMTEHPFDNGELHVRDELLATLPRAPDEIRRHLADYYGMITHMDAQIGRILQALDECRLADRTIVVHTADHGLALGQHGLLGKQNLYEHSIHVPLILRGPGLPSGVHARGLGAQIDIFPTLCALTGTPLPETVEGGSLIPSLQGEGAAGREYVFAAYKSFQRMASDGRWKFIRYYRAHGRGTDSIQLFDLLQDPGEMRNLAEDPAEQHHIRRLENELLRWQKSVGDPLLEARCP